MIVGVNEYAGDETPIEVLQIDEGVARLQQQRLRKLRADRSSEEVRRRLDDLARAAEGDTNVMPLLIDAVKAYATVGEICDVLRGVFGIYQEIAVT